MTKINISYFSIFDSFLFLIGGLCCFLFSLNCLRNNLKILYSSKLYNFIQKYTNTKFKAFLVGILSTIILQSSSGVSAITLALFFSSFLTFPQALLIILGSNIGTCMTGFIISLNLNYLSFYIIISSFILPIFFKNIKIKTIFSSFTYIGFLFLGLDFIDLACQILVDNEKIRHSITMLHNNTLLMFVFGTFITLIIQSSSAVIGLSEALYKTNVLSLIDCVCIMLGANIGTCITGYFVSYNMNKDAKKIVTINLVYNIIGGLLFFILLIPFVYLLKSVESHYFTSNPKLTIAFSHLFFNVFTTIFFYLFFEKILNVFKITCSTEKLFC